MRSSRCAGTLRCSACSVPIPSRCSDPLQAMTQNPADQASPAVRTIAPYVPGKPLEELEREYGIRDSIKLASNENPYGPGPRALEAIAKAAREVGLYPDGSGYALKQALARKHGCAIESITLGN